MKKRILAMLLTLVLCVGLMPTVTVQAAKETLDGGFVVENGILVGYEGEGGDIVLPDGIIGIKTSAFRGHEEITGVVIPESVTEIPDQAFYQCSNLTSVIIPDGVTYIGHNAFSQTGLTSVVIPDSVKAIPEAFRDCKNLKSVSLGRGLTEIAAYAFQGAGLTEVVIPDNITSIGNRAFAFCDELTSITIPASVRKIGDSAFARRTGENSYSAWNDILTVYCEEDSAAAVYAERNATVVLGTFDADGTFVPAPVEPDPVPSGEPSETPSPSGEPVESEVPSPSATSSQSPTPSPSTTPAPSPTPSQPTPTPEPEPEDKWTEWRRVQEYREQEAAAYKNNSRYQEHLQQNQEFLDSDFYGNGKLAYAYIIVTDDVQAKSDEICRGLTSDREKVWAIHEWMTENIYYDYPDYLGNPEYTGWATAQVVLDRKTGVCDGYSILFQALCWAQKIPCVRNTGWTPQGHHAWNLVQIDGEWLWVDTTWDTFNAYYGNNYWQKGSTRLDYFLCSTEVMSMDHETDDNTAILTNPIGLNYYQNVTYPYYQIWNDLRWNRDGSQVKPEYYMYQFTDEELAEASKVRVEFGLKPYVRVENESTTPSGGSSGGGGSSTLVVDERLEQEKQKLEQQNQMFRNLDLSDWAREEVVSALQTSLVPEQIQRYYRTDITREEFCVLMVQLLTRHSGKDIDAYLAQRGLSRTTPFTDTTNSDVLAAYALGIVKGTSETTFNPDGKITRQEAATMLARTAKVLNMKAGQSVDFADADSFADWGKEGIVFVSGITDPYNGKKVMEGTGNGNFSPLGVYSREQAIITALRLFSAAGNQVIRASV